MSTTTHYAVLGVAEDAAYAQIRCRYLCCLLALHPDKQQQQHAEEEAPLSSSRFLRLQEAWDVLRDPQSRSSYDRHLASTRLLLASSVSEDVFLEDMSRDSDDATAGAGASFYVYPCRCGDFFAVSLQELDELGFSEMPTKPGSCRSTAAKDHSEDQAYSAGLRDRNIPNQQVHSACLRDSDVLSQEGPPHEHHSRSLILPCGSCSLRIRLLL